MYERLFTWMSKLSRYLLLVIVTIVILTITYGTSNLSSKAENVMGITHPQIISSHSVSLINVSLWDKQTEPYLETKDIKVYRSPSCSCCGAWVEHLRQHGFNIKADIKTDDIEAIKQKYNLPQELASCHTAIIDGYVMEGHIPADDIKSFLQQKPQFLGLTVPGMPIGTPGMEMGDKKQPFTVMAFDKTGKVTPFKEYKSY